MSTGMCMTCNVYVKFDAHDCMKYTREQINKLLIASQEETDKKIAELDNEVRKIIESDNTFINEKQLDIAIRNLQVGFNKCLEKLNTRIDALELKSREQKQTVVYDFTGGTQAKQTDNHNPSRAKLEAALAEKNKYIEILKLENKNKYIEILKLENSEHYKASQFWFAQATEQKEVIKNGKKENASFLAEINELRKQVRELEQQLRFCSCKLLKTGEQSMGCCL